MSDRGDSGRGPARGVVVAHGSLAEGLVGAVRRIAGVTSEALCGIPGGELGRRDLCKRILAELTGPRNLIFTDLPSGSCHLAALIVTRENPGVPVMTGVNLPMLLDFVFHRRLAARGQNPPGIRTATHPRWPLRFTRPRCKVHITLCNVCYTFCHSKAALCVAPRANSAAIPPSSRLASPAPRRSRCSGGFIHGLPGFDELVPRLAEKGRAAIGGNRPRPVAAP